MAEWMTGVVIMDRMAVEAFMGAMQALNDPGGMNGVAIIDMPTGFNAAAQAEKKAPAEKTGPVLQPWPHISGYGDIYPT